jgi:hypothetical protein
MELLKELDACCSNKWVLRTLGVEQDDSKLRKFYHLVHAGTLTDAEMAMAIYGDGTPANYPPYRTLKTRLKEAYLNTVSLQEHKVPNYKTYDEAYQNGHRLLGIVKILLSRNETSIARKIAEKAFKQVQPFGILSLNQSLTDLLASLYLGSFFDAKKYRLYEQLNQYYSKAAYDLSIVRRYYRDTRLSMYAERTSPYEVGQKVGKYVEECAVIREQYPLIPLIQSMLISIEMTGCMLRGEYRKAIEVSLRGNQILDKLKGVSKANKSVLALTRVECSIKLKDFELGREQINLARDQYISDPINDLALRKNAILLGLSTGNYGFAYQHFSNTSLNSVKRILPPVDVQSWMLLEAYLNFLIQAKELIIQDDWPKLRRFRVGSFLNSVGEITHNKGGTNVQILIIRFLFSLLQNKHDVLINQAERLKTYAGRYLKGPENIRNRSFFRLMELVVRVNFNRLAALKKSQATLRKLEDSEGKPGLNDTELVSYEALWRIMLEQLEVRKRDEQELKQLNVTIKLT